MGGVSQLGFGGDFLNCYVLELVPQPNGRSGSRLSMYGATFGPCGTSAYSFCFKMLTPLQFFSSTDINQLKYQINSARSQSFQEIYSQSEILH